MRYTEARMSKIALEMDKEGRLLIKKDDGSLVAVDSGEVHVRGLYGYV